MNPDTQNRLVDAALQAVKSALVRLNELQIRVLKVCINNLPTHHPKVLIDIPPASVQLARGLVRQTRNYQTWAARIGECQVEWTCPR